LAASHLLVSGHRHRLQWDPESSRELIKFGKWIFLSTALTFFALKLDVLILGKFLTLSELGIYSIAAVFSKGALDVASRLGSSVMFPVYARFKDQPEKLMDVALSAREVVLWIGAAVCICFAVSAPLFFETFWDSRYHQAGMLAQWLTLYMWARLLLNSMDRIPLALGDSKALFLSGIVQNSGILFALAGYWLGGLPFFILGLTAGPMASHMYLLRHVPNRSGDMLRQSAQFTVLAAIAGSVLVGGTSWLRASSTASVWIVAVLLSALFPLLASAWVAYRRIYRERKKST
jgi:O-antigen/teichoic acid export membrane protein